MPAELNIDGSAFSFVGWKDDHLSFYALDQAGRQVVVEPALPKARGARWCEGFGFPKRVPMRIEPARLIPPPCRASEEAAAGIGHEVAAGLVNRQWEALYGEVLYPKPEHEKELKKRLKDFLKQQAQKEAKALSKREESSDVVERVREWRCINQAYHGGGPQALYRVGAMNVTLELVKSENLGGIRDQCLRESWAKQRGFDLEAMEREKRRFLAYAREKMLTRSFKSRSMEYGWSEAMEMFHAKETELLASVRYVMRFRDGEPCYLAGYECRLHLTPGEVKDVAVLLNGSASSRKAEEKWPSERVSEAAVDAAEDSTGVAAPPGDGGKRAKATPMGIIVQRRGRLKWLPGCDTIWLDDEPYALRRYQRARACLQYLVEHQAFDKDSARHLVDEIEVYVREGFGERKPQQSTAKIQDYFKASAPLLKLCREIVTAAGDGKYFLQVE